MAPPTIGSQVEPPPPVTVMVVEDCTQPPCVVGLVLIAPTGHEVRLAMRVVKPSDLTNVTPLSMPPEAPNVQTLVIGSRNWRIRYMPSETYQSPAGMTKLSPQFSATRLVGVSDGALLSWDG